MAPGAVSTTSILALPSELLQHICSKLKGPYDLASAHLVDIRCVRSDEKALTKCIACCCVGGSTHQRVMLVQRRLTSVVRRYTVWCRFCAAARAVLHSARPLKPGFLELGKAASLPAAPPRRRWAAILHAQFLPCTGVGW